MHIPQRMCVCCRERNTKDNLIRIINRKNNLCIDNKKKYNGRAIYVCKKEDCINLLKKSNALKRYLQLDANDEFYIQLKNFK